MDGVYFMSCGLNVIVIKVFFQHIIVYVDNFH